MSQENVEVVREFLSAYQRGITTPAGARGSYREPNAIRSIGRR
jgi:hypothetical protein